MPAKGYPITVGGVTYPSRYAAAQALGIKLPTLYWRLKNIKEPSPSVFTAPIPVTVNGQAYSSLSAAAKALGVSKETMSRAHKEQGPVITYTKRPGSRNPPRPVTIDGKTYPSVRQAARELGVSYPKLQRMYPR